MRNGQMIQDTGRTVVHAARVNAAWLEIVVTMADNSEFRFPLTREALALLQQLLNDVIVGRCAAEGLAYRASEAERMSLAGVWVWGCPKCRTPLDVTSDEFPF